ncbi:hypothetical protein [Tardiphaga sp. 813_E8_N1_3]
MAATDALFNETTMNGPRPQHDRSRHPIMAGVGVAKEVIDFYLPVEV